MNSDSFTVKWDGLVNQLITIVDITLPVKQEDKFDPTGLIRFNGLWDTGATGTVINKKIVDALGLIPIGKTICHHANGQDIVNVYNICLVLPNNVAMPILRVTEGVLTGFDVLIGMDIIGKGDFAVSNYKGRTVMSFRMPSTHESDFVKEHNIAEIKAKKSRPKQSGTNITPPKKKRRK